MADVVVYTTEPCGFCKQAKALLESRGVRYEEINLAKDPQGRADLVALTGQMTFPQVLIDGRPLGGFCELVRAGSFGGSDRGVVRAGRDRWTLRARPAAARREAGDRFGSVGGARARARLGRRPDDPRRPARMGAALVRDALVLRLRRSG